MATEKLALVPMENEMNVYNLMAHKAIASKFYRNYGDEAALITIMLSAREIGIPPMAALNGGLNIIKGKVEISARLMNAMIRRAGHSIKTVESTDVICKLCGTRADNSDTETVSFSIEDAKNAGLVRSEGGWKKYPTDMLFARALSRLARRLFPDVIGCAYVEGEIGEAKLEVIEDAEVTAITEKQELEMLAEFLKAFDKDDGMYMACYMKQVHEKYGIGYSSIILKYEQDKESFDKNFVKWKVANKNKEEVTNEKP